MRHYKIYPINSLDICPKCGHTKVDNINWFSRTYHEKYKCGSTHITRKLCPYDVLTHSYVNGEHHHCKCNICNYQWVETVCKKVRDEEVDGLASSWRTLARNVARAAMKEEK